MNDRLSPARKAVLAAEIVVAYAHVRWTLRRQDFPRALESIRARGSRASRADAATDDRLARAVRRTLRRLPADTRCLMQSLVLTRLLERRGRRSQLVIGVTAQDRFGAHAWVERNGIPLLPAHERTFERLAEL